MQGLIVGQIQRHQFKKSAASVAVTRLRKSVDDEKGSWKLRGLGRQRAAEIQSRLG